jgi:Rtr1/RPAP2 family
MHFKGQQVAEERALTGLCGSPMCMQQLERAAGGKLRRKLYQSTYCR